MAPSRCGKTPTTMYLALQHGVFVANYPLVDEDFESPELISGDVHPGDTLVTAAVVRRRSRL